MAAVTVYVLDASEIIDPGYQACVLLYKFGKPIILSKDVKVLSSQLTRKPGHAVQPSSSEMLM